ncbi:PREDICTED: testicular haploid expressed gene protein-like [Acanthisitta chloris]|uniref:testicular haploid expressed gene protein-like n=1 Tax=Acanthisitta chloris TaxID=57068 RepID=UPI0004F0FA31|nr:PREDICTED: testicular haploid expressed gene protein-like [Acanthisitta chloris]
MEFLEIGGSESLRSYWKMYLPKVLLLVFVVDSADHARLPVAKQLLHQLIQNNSTLPVVVLANKQDLKGAYCITDIHDALALSDIGDERKMFLIGTHVAEDGSEISSSMKDAKELIAQLVLETHLDRILALAEPKKAACESDPSLDRILALAEPKKAACESDPRNQETIWTLSGGTMTAQPSSRTLAPAKHRKDFGKHQRRSVIWESTICGCVPLRKDFSFLSDRLLKLSEPKKCPPAYLLQRPRESPEWPVSPAALSYDPSPRILKLARPKKLHPEFQPPRELPIPVSHLATLARISMRLERLAEPCARRLPCCCNRSFPDSVICPVSKSAQEAIASPRTIELARPRKLHLGYVPPRDPQWPVTTAAKHAVATPRLVKLAQPRSR